MESKFRVEPLTLVPTLRLPLLVLIDKCGEPLTVKNTVSFEAKSAWVPVRPLLLTLMASPLSALSII